MSYLKQDSRPIATQDIKIHNISVTPIPTYNSWSDFLQTSGLDTKTITDYLHKFSKVKFDTNRIKVIDSNILDKIGVVDINHQMMILERIENLKQLETAHTIETKLNKLISTLNDEARRRHEGSLSSSGGTSPGTSLPSSANLSQDLISGMKSPLSRSNKDNPVVNNTNNNSTNASSQNNTNNNAGGNNRHTRNLSTGNMIV